MSKFVFLSCYVIIMQMVEAGNAFPKYDYGEEENLKRYNGSATPPLFPLDKVDVPLFLFYGNGDKLIAEKDVEALAKALPSTEVALYSIDYEGWNHNDSYLYLFNCWSDYNH